MGRTFRARANNSRKRSPELRAVERLGTEIRRVGGHSLDWSCSDADVNGVVCWTVAASAPDGERITVERSGHRASNAPLRRALAAMLLEVQRHQVVRS